MLPTERLFAIIDSMLKDRIENISNYYALDDNLRNFSMDEELPVFYGFIEDKEHSRIFAVDSGSAVFATSWRENPLSRETTGAIVAGAGDFILYLPGEPILVKAGEDSLVRMGILG